MKDKKIRFNGIDIFIILVVIAVAAAGAYLLFGGGGTAVITASSNVEITAVVELPAKAEDFAALVKEGDAVKIGEKEKTDATVKSVEVMPAKTTGYDILTGRAPFSEIPGEYDIHITLELEGTETDRAIEMNGTAMRVGNGIAVNSKGWAGYGFIIGLETSEIQ